MPAQRIYMVIHAVDDKPDTRRLVEASSAAQAIRHCARPHYTAKPANARDVAQCMKNGQTIEQANENEGSN